jgi:hypothetical protein
MILILWDDRNAIAIPRTTGLFSRLFRTRRARFSGNKKISSPFLFFAISRGYFPNRNSPRLISCRIKAVDLLAISLQLKLNR